LQSTPSSADGGGNSPRRPSRAAIAALVLICVLVPAAGLAYALTRDSADTATHRITAGVGKPAPQFRLPSTTGETVALSQFRGKPVILAFFASWCHPCEEEMPALEDVQREAGDEVQVLAVNYQDHIGTDSKDFVERLKVTYPALLEPEGDPVAADYGVHQIPQTFFIDADGVVRDRIYGESSRKDLQPAIDALLDRDT
jgi:peroxiredoxin